MVGVPESDDDEDEQRSTPDGAKSKKTLDRRDKFIIFLLSFGNFALGCSYALLAPFFPKEVSNKPSNLKEAKIDQFIHSSFVPQAELKGVQPSQYSLVFSVFEFGIFLLSPLYGKLVSGEIILTLRGDEP